MRILRVITRLNAGGPSRHVVWANAGLSHRGHQTLLAAGPVGQGEDDLSGIVRDAGIDFVEIQGLHRSPRFGNDFSALAQLVRVIRDFRPDVVHTHTAKAGTLGRLAVLASLALLDIPHPRVFHTFHGHTLTGYFLPAISLFYRGVEALLAGLATNVVVTLSPLQRDEITRLLRLNPAKVVVVPIGLDLSVFESLPDRGSFRSELGLAPDRFLWGAVGRIAPVKNYPILFDVARHLRSRLGPKSPMIVVVGGGEGLAELRERVVRDGLSDALAFVGPRFDLPRLYADLDGVVLCSNQEGTPLCLIEAIACGLPIVATRVGGVPDLLTKTFQGPVRDRSYRTLENPRGVLVPAEDAEALAAALTSRPRRGSAEASTYSFRLERLLDDLEDLYGVRRAISTGAV